jgi:hypothetical protein
MPPTNEPWRPEVPANPGENTGPATHQGMPHPHAGPPQNGYAQPPHPFPPAYHGPPRKQRAPAWVWVMVGCAALLLVLAVLGVIGSLAFVFMANEPDMARWERARTEMGQIHTALSRYQLDHGEYPDSLNDIADSFDHRVPHDPFTRAPYIYQRTDRGFRLICYGADHAPGGPEIPNRDIIFTERGKEDGR